MVMNHLFDSMGQNCWERIGLLRCGFREHPTSGTCVRFVHNAILGHHRGNITGSQSDYNWLTILQTSWAPYRVWIKICNPQNFPLYPSVKDNHVPLDITVSVFGGAMAWHNSITNGSNLDVTWPRVPLTFYPMIHGDNRMPSNNEHTSAE